LLPTHRARIDPCVTTDLSVEMLSSKKKGLEGPPNFALQRKR
jgi:hypothetical protein